MALIEGASSNYAPTSLAAPPPAQPVTTTSVNYPWADLPPEAREQSAGIRHVFGTGSPARLS